MVTCCELARQALWVIGGAFGVILALLAMFFGYSLTLGNRTAKLEKKNGHEQEQIKQLQKELEQLKTQLTENSPKHA